MFLQLLVAVLLTSLAAAAGENSTVASRAASFKFRPFTTPGVIGYWTNWSPYSRPQNTIDKLDLTGFTAINYAFVNVDASGNLVTFDGAMDDQWIAKFNGLRSKYPKLRTIVSLGGWSGSMHFSTVAKSASLTKTFVKNVHKFLDEKGFDGVDIDWEYPTGGGIECNSKDPNDALNLVNLLKALRKELGKSRSISLAVSAETKYYVDKSGKQQIPNILKYANYVQIMTYDFYGSWVPYSDFNSPLDIPGKTDPQAPKVNSKGYSQPLSQKAAINAWIKAGAKPAQLTNGLAFYGRSWSVQSKKNNGLYQLCTGSSNNAACTGIVGDFLDEKVWCDPCKVCYNTGVWMYNNLRGQQIAAGSQSSAPLAGSATAAGNGWTRQYFDFAQSPTLYSPNYRGKSAFISYDDPTSIKAKAAWAKSMKLGGTMIWELSQDYQKELVSAVRAGWGN
ncbi:glycoside hydrolase superfamily [Obelidium mucronatum]|nr:glycoside hydrolase superfamily [Obelidium mucronatum]